MGKVKVRIRKEPVSADSLERHKNYSVLLKQHERKKRYKRTLQWFFYSLIVTIILLLLVSLAVWMIHIINNPTTAANQIPVAVLQNSNR